MSKIVLNADIRTKDKFDFSPRIIARKVIREVLKHENCPFDVTVELILTDAAEIKEVNREFREIDQVTDVLSFPNLEYETPSDFVEATKASADCMDPTNGTLYLGDIMINCERVKEQAVAYGHSELREYAFLVAHSMFHLCGYDHMDDEEREEMEALQEGVLHKLGIVREGNESSCK